MDANPQVGARLGRFQLEKELGGGSTGTVYLAQDTLLNVKVALKVLSPSIAESEDLQRLSSEVLLARRVSHPGVCRIFDLHIEGKVLFITMEYVEGQTLESILQERKVLPFTLAGNLSVSICRALNAAHQQGVVHRGLTPSNIVVRQGDRISITDFGLIRARDIAETTGAGAPLDSIHYVSPEVLSGMPATAQSDIYSLGVILYRCVTGNLPFQGNQVLQVTNAVLEGRIVQPRLFNPDVPQSMEKVVIKAMARHPDKRYPTISEFREWIAAVFEGVNDEPGDEEAVRALWNADIDVGADEPPEDTASSQTQQIRMNKTTILFSDIVGFTQYFDKHGDMAGRKRLQQHNELLFPVIQRHHGAVIKTIGDAIMAHFDLADHGVEAAVAMQLTLDAFNKKMADPEERIFIRIGLHTGQAIIENQDVFGDAVNVASRVSAKAGAAEVMISEFTKDRLTRNEPFVRFHSSTPLKGKSHEYNLFSVAWRAEERQAASGNPPVPAPTLAIPKADNRKFSGAITPAGGTPLASIPTPPMGVEQASGVPDLGESMLSETDGLSGEITQAGVVTQAADPFLGTGPTLELPAAESQVASKRRMDMEMKNGLPLPPLDDSQVGTQPGAPAPAIKASGSPVVVVSTDTSSPPLPAQVPARQGMRPALLVAIGAGLGSVIVAGLVLIIMMFNQSGKSGDSSATGSVDPGAQPAEKPPDEDIATKEDPAGKETAEKPEGSPDEPAIDISVETKPEPVTKTRPKVTAGASLKVRAEKMDWTIRSAMKKSGFLFGDSRELAQEYRKMRELKRKGKYADAHAAGQRALDALQKIKINKAFVQAKLLRFNEKFDNAGNTPAADELEGLAMSIMSAIEGGRYERANKLLNRSFRLLNKKK